MDMNFKEKIGILGGSFNPIHNGHIEIAKYLVDNQYVDSVCLMPTIGNPFKIEEDEPDAYHRYKMTEIAVNDSNFNDSNYKIQSYPLSVSNFELQHFSDRECAYTVDVLKKLIYSDISKYGEKYEYYFIMGCDTFNNITKFKDYSWLLHSGLIKIIVINRPGYTINSSFKINELDNVISVNDGPENNISSTEIRNLIQNGKIDNCELLLRKDVIKYIKDNKLYGYKNN